jgi:hypothetical protein
VKDVTDTKRLKDLLDHLDNIPQRYKYVPSFGVSLVDFKTILENQIDHKEQDFSVFTANHTCRETLLYSLFRCHSSFDYISGNEFAMIRYKHEGSNKLSLDLLQKISRFDRSVLGTSSAPFQIKVDTENRWVDIYFLYSPTGSIDVSLFLWIIRNQEILDLILREFPENATGSFNRMLKFLSKLFLDTNKVRESEYNPSIYLSMYCFYRASDYFMSINKFHNGPVEYIMNELPLFVLFKYLTDLYIPTLGSDVSIISNHSRLRSDYKGSLIRLIELISGKTAETVVTGQEYIENMEDEEDGYDEDEENDFD